MGVWVCTQQLHSDKQAENSTAKLLTMPLDVGQINLFEGVAAVALVVFAFPWSSRRQPLVAPFETAKGPEPNPSGFVAKTGVFPGRPRALAKADPANSSRL